MRAIKATFSGSVDHRINLLEVKRVIAALEKLEQNEQVPEYTLD